MSAMPTPVILTEGLDVSGFQADPSTHKSLVDWFRVAASGRKFSYIKASEGNTGHDRSFQSHSDGAGAAGVIRGAYHFGHPDSGLGDAVAEAKLFKQCAGDQPYGSTLPPAFDFEQKPVMDAQKAAQWIANFLAECDQQFQRSDCLVYTSPSFWTGTLQVYGNDPRFGSRPLWLAEYYLPAPRVTPLALAPLPWREWAVWQYGGGAKKPYGNEATCPGVPGWADLNVFRGTSDDLQRFIGASVEAVPQTLRTFRTLGEGSLGQDVRDLQAFLNAQSCSAPPLTVDGIFGPRTSVALKTLQQRAGLTVDGVFGPASQAAAIRLGF